MNMTVGVAMTSTSSKRVAALFAASRSPQRRVRYSRAETSDLECLRKINLIDRRSQSGSSRSRKARNSIADTPPSTKTAKASRASGSGFSFTTAPARASEPIAERTISSMPFSQPSQNQESAIPMRTPLMPVWTRRRKAKPLPGYQCRES